MLGYNDAIAANSVTQQLVSCQVCHDLLVQDSIIWHRINLMPEELLDVDEVLVPICVDCADLFHDVSTTRKDS